MINRAISLVVICASGALVVNAAELEGERAQLSYSVGMNVGNALKRQGMDVDLEVLTKGIRDVLSGVDTDLTEQEARDILISYQRDASRKVGEASQKEADAWLAGNKTKEGIKTTDSGLQYQVITEGTGLKPALTDTVRVHYRGTLIDGTEFDNSYTRGPAEFPVTGVIKGWTEALQLMGVGSKWKLYIPPDLAYGPSGRPSIPPNSVLQFDIELLGIVEK